MTLHKGVSVGDELSDLLDSFLRIDGSKVELVEMYFTGLLKGDLEYPNIVRIVRDSSLKASLFPVSF